MLLESIKNNEIQEELDCIARTTVHSGYQEKEQFKIIESATEFKKTDSYKRLRTGGMSDDELSFMINEYVWGSEEICELIVSKIKNLTITKAVSVGLLSYCLHHMMTYNAHRTCMTDIALSSVEVEDFDIELDHLLTFLEYRGIHFNSKDNDTQILGDILRRYWYNALDDYDGKNMSSEEEGAVKAIVKHYNRIYNIYSSKNEVIKSNSAAIVDSVFMNTSTWHNTGLSRYTAIEPFAYIERSASPLRSIKDNIYIKEMLNTLKYCPFILMDFIYKQIESNKQLTAEEKIYFLISGMVGSRTNPLEDCSDELIKIETLSDIWGIDTPLSTLLNAAISNDRSSLSNFITRLTTQNNISLNRREEIYNRYFHNISYSNFYDYDIMRLQLMIDFQLNDKWVSEYVTGLFRKEPINRIKECFKCIPSNQFSYPGRLTLNAIIKQEIAEASPYSMLKNTSEENSLYKLYYSMGFSVNTRTTILSWRLANSKWFLREILNSQHLSPRGVNSIVAKMNLKNIGFDVYIRMVEDLARENKSIAFERTSRNALQFATQSEIFMYKRKMDKDMLLGSASVGYKTIDFYLRLIEKNKFSKDQSTEMLTAIAIGIGKNPILSKDELIDILNRAATRKNIYKMFTNEYTIKKGIYTAAIRNVSNYITTVEDISNYYDKMEG